MNNLPTCIVVTRFVPGQPGYLDFAYRIKALAQKYKVTLLSYYPLTVPEMQIEGVTQVVLTGGESNFRWLYYLWLVNRYIRMYKPSRVVLLHAMTAPLVYFIRRFPHALYWNEHASRVLGIEDSGFLRTLLRRIKYRLLFMTPAKHAELVMPIGEALRDDLLAQGCHPERVRMIYMGVDDCFIGVAMHRLRRDANVPLELIYTGTVQKERGRDVMLEAIAKVNDAGVPVRLTLVGASHDERDYCALRARELNIVDKVSIFERVVGSEIPRFLAAADAGICLWEDRPWWRFNPPTKLFEYLVSGLPVLASNIQTHTLYIKDGDNGFIFDYDSASLANAITELWRRRTELDAMKRRTLESGRPYRWSSIEPSFIETMVGLARS